MNYLVSGGTGFIGSALSTALLADGHQVTVLTRGGNGPLPECRYIACLDELDDSASIDAIINMAGASMAGRRWNGTYKQEIINSRITTTDALLALCRRLHVQPGVFMSASAIGYYGPHGEEVLDEEGSVVPSFSSDLCRQWERAALAAEDLGIRVVLLRLGVVLDREGGALGEMARPFNFGIANWIGSGDQWLSWVHRRDVVRACRFLLGNDSLAGAYNITSPGPVTSRGFCDAMKARKKTLLTVPMPASVMRLLAGEMADELLLSGQRVVPERLLQAGFEFSFPSLPEALLDIV